MSSDKIVLNVKKRELTGKKVAQLRAEDQVPAVVYGKDFEPVNIQANYLDLVRTIKQAGTHSLVELDIDGTKQTVIIKDFDIDPVKNRINHISFQAVSADQVVTTEVPIVVVAFNESEAGKAGFEIMQAIDEIQIKAKPADLPKQLEVSAISSKEHGDKLVISDIKLPEGVLLADENDSELTIASVVDPAIEAARQEAIEKAEAEKQAAAEAAAATTEEGEQSAEGETSESTEESSEAEAKSE